MPPIDGESKPDTLFGDKEDTTGSGSLPKAEPVGAAGSGSAITAEIISEGTDASKAAAPMEPAGEEFDLAKLTEEEPAPQPDEKPAALEVPSFDDSAAGKLGTEAELGELSQFFKDAKRPSAPEPAKAAPAPSVPRPEAKPTPPPAAPPRPEPKPAAVSAPIYQPKPVSEPIAGPKTEAKPVPPPAPKPEIKPQPAPPPPPSAPKPEAPPPPQAEEARPVFNAVPVEVRGWPKDPEAAPVKEAQKPTPVDVKGWPEEKAESSSSGGFAVEDASGSGSVPAGKASEESISQITVKPGDTTSKSEFNPNFAEQVLDFGAESSGSGRSKSDSAVTRPVAAGIVRAAGAGLIDLAIYFVIAAAFGLAGIWASAISLGGASGSDLAGFIVPVAIVVLLVVWFYQVFFLSVLGQTPGQMFADIEVLDRFNKRPGISKAAVRALIYILCLLPIGLGFIPTLLGASIPDKAAGTKLAYWFDERAA